MKVYARVFTTLAVVVDSAEQLTVFATVSFFNSGAAVNDTAVAYVGSPNLATGLLIDVRSEGRCLSRFLARKSGVKCAAI